MVEEIVAALHGDIVAEPTKQIEQEGNYPALVISLNCAFCPPAKNFWSRVADGVGVDLPVMIVEKEEGVEQKYDISGVPCLVCGPSEKYYGIDFSVQEAKEILLPFSTQTQR